MGRVVLLFGLCVAALVAALALGDYLGTRAATNEAKEVQARELAALRAEAEGRPGLTISIEDHAVPIREAWERRRNWYGAALVAVALVNAGIALFLPRVNRARARTGARADADA